jgi:hypothetical protein
MNPDRSSTRGRQPDRIKCSSWTADHACEEAAHGVLLPSRHLHDGGDRRPLGAAQHCNQLACLEPARGWEDARVDWRDFADRAGGFFGSSAAVASSSVRIA